LPRRADAARPTPAPAQAAAPLPPQHFSTGSVPATRVATVPVTPPAAPRAEATAPKPNGGVRLVGAYTVRKGDTVASIARTYGVSEQALRERNALHTSALTPGQQLLLPAGTKLMLKTSQAQGATPEAKPTTVAEAKPAEPVVKPTVAKPAMQVATAKPAAQVAAAKPVAVTPAAPTPKDTSKIDQHAAETIAVAREPTPADDDKASADAGSFRWPVRGRVISEYGAKANGERNEGINLAVPEGTSVKAADGGEVIYAGNELKGYGNLVLVRHPNGYVTAYAHASELLVSRGEKVNRGQIIARAGATGSVSQPQLHFELRKGQKAVDPRPFLASN
ncbi:MAG: M23 family metallopeptidase, partial [Phyllobacteriaceae bacterium]|nr:M23 family metallopeptidase [Phyllobacteriaceae bacterium]